MIELFPKNGIEHAPTFVTPKVVLFWRSPKERIPRRRSDTLAMTSSFKGVRRKAGIVHTTPRSLQVEATVRTALPGKRLDLVQGVIVGLEIWKVASKDVVLIDGCAKRVRNITTTLDENENPPAKREVQRHKSSQPTYLRA